MMWPLILLALLPTTTVALWNQFPPQNLPSTCAATLCPQGSICQESKNPKTGIVQAQCLVGTYTPPSQQQKPGRCPNPGYGQVGICASTCSSDRDCPGSRKCCRNPCGATTCQDPVSVCSLPCPPGYTCELKPVVCCCAPCNPVPTCVPYIPPQPTCPSYPPYLSKFCYQHDRCHPSHPYSCDKSEVCCSTPCGRRCVSAPWD